MTLIKPKKTRRLLFLTHASQQSQQTWSPLEPPQKIEKKIGEEKVKEGKVSLSQRFQFRVKAKRYGFVKCISAASWVKLTETVAYGFCLSLSSYLLSGLRRWC